MSRCHALPGVPTIACVNCEDPDTAWLVIEDIRSLLGVSKSRAYTISRDRDFPAPIYERPNVRIWLRRDVEAWADSHRPGWRGEG